MKISYISNSVLPSRWANAVHAVAMSSALAGLKHPTRLIGMSGAGGPILAVKEIRRAFRTAPELKISLIPLLRQRHLKRIYGVVAAVLVSRDCDLVISRNLAAAFFCVFFRRKNVVVELHEPVRRGQPSGVFLALLLRRPQRLRVVLITHALLNEMAHHWSPLQDLSTVLPDGAWSDRGTALRTVREMSEGFHVGYVGHLYPGKGAETVIKVARLIEDVHFHIVGGNPSDSKKLAAGPNFPKNVSIHGWIQPSEVPNYLASFDVLVLPNKRNILVGGSGSDIGPWTSPLKLFEYMAAGKPIVASNLPVLREVLEDKKNSLLCEPDTVSEWVASLKLLKDDRALAERLGAQARLELLSKYSWEKRAANLVSLFSTL